MSPAQMFAHSMARAGYIEVPRDPHLGLEFLETSWRTIQPYGVEIGGCRYDGAGLPKDGRPSPYPNGLWPFQVNPDDITRVYFRDPDGRWRMLHWEHAPVLNMPMSRDALRYGRAPAAKQYRHPNDRLVTADLFERWNLGFGQTLAERRMALRMARDQAAFVIDIEDDKPVLKAGMTRLRETEAERDRLREALEETKEELEATLKENRSLSRHRPGK
jgi:hypothetical protein